MPAVPAPPPSRPARLEFIDLLRGWAVIVMIETHVVNATLTPAAMTTAWFGWLAFMNGLVAPSFLFASGLAFAVTLRRKAADLLRPGPALRKQLGRMLLILAIGYILHLPFFSLQGLLAGTTEREWLMFLQADVLHCIAVTLLLLVLLLLVLRSEARVAAAAAVLAGVAIIAAPWVWRIDYLGLLPAAAGAYLNGLHFSLFPLFPWSGFLLAGVVTGHHFSRIREGVGEDVRVRRDRFMRRAAAAGLAALAAAWPLTLLGDAVYPEHPYWRAGPGFVVLRLGLVALLMAGMYLVERRRGVSAGSLVTLLGRESLFVYTLHLLLIYGDLGPWNFRKMVDHSFGWGEAVLTTVLLLGICTAAALAWARVKAGPVLTRRRITIGFAAGLGLVFLLTPA